MSTRVRLALAIVAFVPLTVAFAKEKNGAKAATLPAFVTDAHTVAVVIFPEASNPLINPNANRNAQSEVEQVLTKWGRLRLGVDPQTSDLVIAIRKNAGAGPTTTIGGGGIN